MKKASNKPVGRHKLGAFCIALVCVLFVSMFSLVVRSNAQELVICLDPGHGGDEKGASNWVDGVEYYENPLNLKIALACRKYLLEYPGVKVIMTRETTAENPSLAERVSFATKNGAHCLVSIHNNASDPEYSGTIICTANSDYRPQLTKETHALGNCLLEALSKLGLQNRGFLGTMAKLPNYTAYYPDGSLQDYYGIVMRSKRAGIPGVICECSFITNPDDCRNYLSSDYKLDQMGKRIAEGIANYYKLSYYYAYDAPEKLPIDSSHLVFNRQDIRDLFYPYNGTTVTGENEAVISNTSGNMPSVFLDYFGMSVETSDYSHVVLRMKSSKYGTRLRIYTANDNVITNNVVYSYDMLLSEEYQDYVLDLSKLPTWKGAFNYFQFDVLSGTDFTIEYLTFKSGNVVNGIAPNPDYTTPTPEPTPTPTPEPTEAPTPEPTEEIVITPEPTAVPENTWTPEPIPEHEPTPGNATLLALLIPIVVIVAVLLLVGAGVVILIVVLKKKKAAPPPEDNNTRPPVTPQGYNNGYNQGGNNFSDYSYTGHNLDGYDNNNNPDRKS